MNKVIKILILSDFCLISGGGLIVPIFAIFLTQQIQGGDVKLAGYAAAVYWIVTSLVLIPVGKYLDRNHGEKDDLWFIIAGNLLAALAMAGYLFAYLPWHVYVLEGLYALGMGMNVPAYTAVFTRHIDQGKEAYEWGVRSALIGIGTAAAGAAGGLVAAGFGFRALFIAIAAFFVSSSLVMFLVRRDIFKKTESQPEFFMDKDIQPPHSFK